MGLTFNWGNIVQNILASLPLSNVEHIYFCHTKGASVFSIPRLIYDGRRTLWRSIDTIVLYDIDFATEPFACNEIVKALGRRQKRGMAVRRITVQQCPGAHQVHTLAFQSVARDVVEWDGRN